MDLKDDVELSNTRLKLAELEARYEELRDDSAIDKHVQQVTMRSLKRYINQFKEEIARYECRRVDQFDAETPRDSNRDIASKVQLEHTRDKLHRLQELVEANTHKVGDDELRRSERISLKRLINQFKEEIARYEARQHLAQH